MDTHLENLGVEEWVKTKHKR